MARFTFSVTATGTPPLTYQWQRSDDGGASFADVAGANAISYTTPATSVGNDNGDRYRVRVSNLEGASTSQAATLTVTAAIVARVEGVQPTEVLAGAD